MIEHTGQTTHHEDTEGNQSAIAQFIEDVAGALLTPVVTLRSVGERQAIVPAMMLVLLIVVVNASGQVATILLNVGQLLGFGPELVDTGAGSLAALQVTAIVGNLVWAPVFWTITAGIVYGVARLLGGRGNFMALWAATGFALVPQLLIAPLTSASDVLSWLGAGWQFLGWLVVFPLTVIGLIWTLILYAIAVRETMSLSTGQSIATIAILVAAAILLVVLLICVLLIFVFGLLALIVA